MVFQNIQANLPVGTVGFKSRPRGDFQPGEYKRLSNVEIIEDKLVGRRNMKMPNYNESGEYIRRSGMRHIGFWQDWTIYSDDRKIVAYSTSGEVSLLSDITDLLPYNYDTITLGGMTFEGFHNVVGFFTYLGYNYILVFSYLNRTGIASSSGSFVTASGYKLYRYVDKPSNSTPPVATYTDWYLIGSDEVYNNEQPLPDVWVPGLKFEVQVASESDYMNSYINNFFFFKDRLYICTQHGLYFSRATDPTDFSLVNGGGYFKTGEAMTYAVGSDDKIYVFSKNSVYVITYSEDPNVDAVVSKISDVIGGATACIFRSSVYFVNNEGLFTVNNNSVEKVMDTDFDDGLNVFTAQSLSAFGEYLVLNKCYENSVAGTPALSDDYGIRTNLVAGSTQIAAGNRGIGGNIEPTFWAVSTGGKETLTEVEAFGLPPVSSTSALEVTNTDVSAGHNFVGVFSPATIDATKMNVIVPGEVYTLSGYIKAIDGLSVGSSYIGAHFYTSGAVLKAQRSSLNPDTITTGDGVQVFTKVNPVIVGTDIWYRYSMTFKVTDPTITRLRIFAISQTFALNGTAQFGGFMLEKSNEVGDFIGDNLTDWVGTFWGPTQHGGTTSFWTTYSNPAFKYWEDVYPYWFRDGIDPNGNLTGFNTYFINMDSGAVHVLDYKHLFNDEIVDYDGFISHVVVNSNYSDQVPNGDTLFFLNSDRYGTNGELPNQYVSYMNYEVDSTVFDHVVHLSSDGTKIRKKADPRYLVEIDSYVPDGTEYMMKKFRNFEVMGKFPKKRFEFSRAVDNQAFNVPVEVVDNPDLSSTPLRLHLPHRMGINQRGKSISLRLATKHGPPLDEDYDFFELSDMKFLWTYTDRDTKSRSFTPAPG